jgi:hypothetical protein
MSGAPVQLGRIWARLCEENRNWSAEVDRVVDLPTYDVTISEDEGEFPVLEIAFENQGVGIDTLVGGMPRILLSVDRLDAELKRVDTVLLFDGTLDDAGDVEMGGEDVTLRYEARRDDWQALRDAVLATIGLPFADPCAGDLSDPVERLDAIPSLVCWSRTTRQPVLSSAINGGGGTHHDIGTRHAQGACRVRPNGKPLGRVDVVLSAEWTERRIAEFDVGEMIEDAAGGDLSTLTPEELAKDWAKPGSDFSGGYVVSDADLELLDAPQGAVETVEFEQAAAAARTFRPGATQPQVVRVRRRWLKPVLSLGATSETKRREEVRFSIYNAGQGASTDSETIEIKLDRLQLDLSVPDWQPNIHYGQGAIVRFAGFVWRSLEPHDATESLWVDRVDEDDLGRRIYRWELVIADGSPLGTPMAPSFFNTPRGWQSIEHGIAAGSQRLAYSQRNYDIDVDPLDLVTLLSISTRDTIRVVAPGIIPGEGSEAIGKVKSYKLHLSASEATLSVTLGVSSGSGTAGGTAAGGRRTVAWGPNWSRVAYVAPVYAAPYAPQMGIAKVTVANDAPAQIAHLQQAAADGRDLGKALDEVPTSIRVTVLPTGGGETVMPIMIAVTPYQGFRGISTR